MIQGAHDVYTTSYIIDSNAALYKRHLPTGIFPEQISCVCVCVGGGGGGGEGGGAGVSKFYGPLINKYGKYTEYRIYGSRIFFSVLTQKLSRRHRNRKTLEPALEQF